MSVVVPIENLENVNTFRIAEILFDNSETLPNDIYVHFMNLLKRYHEYPCEQNENEIRKYIKKIDKPLRIQFERYLPPPKLFNCKCNEYLMRNYLIFGIVMMGFVFLGGMFFAIFTRSHSRYVPPPPINKK
jgi:hypothetical protein